MKSQQTSLHLEGCNAEVSLNLKRSRESGTAKTGQHAVGKQLYPLLLVLLWRRRQEIGTMYFSGDALPLPFFFQCPRKTAVWNGKKNDPFAWKQSNRKSKRSDWSLLAESRIFEETAVQWDIFCVKLLNKACKRGSSMCVPPLLGVKLCAVFWDASWINWGYSSWSRETAVIFSLEAGKHQHATRPAYITCSKHIQFLYSICYSSESPNPQMSGGGHFPLSLHRAICRFSTPKCLCSLAEAGIEWWEKQGCCLQGKYFSLAVSV